MMAILPFMDQSTSRSSQKSNNLVRRRSLRMKMTLDPRLILIDRGFLVVRLRVDIPSTCTADKKESILIRTIYLVEYVFVE